MRDYSKIASTFWTGVTGRALRGDAPAQVVAMYLLTNPHSTMIGVYTCPPMYIAHETGLTITQAEQSLVRLEELGFCLFDRDRDLIWVREMARFQVGDTLSPGDRRVKNVASHFAKIPAGAVRDGFARRYGTAFHLPSDGSSKEHGKGHLKDHTKEHQTSENAPSKPCEQPKMPLRSQEQEQEQKSPVLTDGGPSPPADAIELNLVLDHASGGRAPPLRLVSDPEPSEPQSSASTDTSTPERELFARGKAVLGSNAGGQVAKLLKAKGGNIALARAAIETASTKHNAREYVARLIRGDDTGMPPGQLYDRSI